MHELDGGRLAGISDLFTPEESDVIIDSGALEHLAERKSDYIGFLLCDARNVLIADPVFSDDKAKASMIMALEIIGAKRLVEADWGIDLDNFWSSIVMVSGPDETNSRKDNPYSYGFSHEQRMALGAHAVRVTPVKSAKVEVFQAQDPRHESFLRDAWLFHQISRELFVERQQIINLPAVAESQELPSALHAEVELLTAA